jgi:hypothetical protein
MTSRQTRSALAATVLALTMHASHAAPAPQPPDLFDFWVGDWSATWKNADGTAGKGRNRIQRTLDGKVIEEQFEEDAADPPPVLRGHSVSVLQQQAGVWRQAWVDNQGGYFSFTASVEGDKRIFATAFYGEGDKIKGQRMVFRDITRDAFMWDWEGTSDGGKTWTLLWQIAYKRLGG